VAQSPDIRDLGQSSGVLRTARELPCWTVDLLDLPTISEAEIRRLVTNYFGIEEPLCIPFVSYPTRNGRLVINLRGVLPAN
jgi:hypothetical protein